MAGKLNKLGIETVWDMLSYVPFRYDDFSRCVPIGSIRPGQTITVTGDVQRIGTFSTKNGKQIVSATLTDNSGSVDIIWFHQRYLLHVIKKGDTLRVSGTADWFGKKIVFTAPTYEVVTKEDSSPSLHTGRLVPIYPETDGLNSKWLRTRIAATLHTYRSSLVDLLPPFVRDQEQLMELSCAIETVHFPKTIEEATKAKARLAFDELFFLLLRTYEQKRQWQTIQQAVPIPLSDEELAQFLHSLPFTLTDDQKAAINDIAADINKSIPMNRLLEGDVGSGKTVVAACAIYAAIKRNTSAIVMAPTQLLATQHWQTLSRLLSVFDIPVSLITADKTHNADDPSPTRVLVGTHALLTHDDLPSNCSLIIVDEQQRFGVTQRATLRAITKGSHTPHQLTMTATPIPRTLLQTIFGNLDISVIDSMPIGRKPVKTWLVPNAKREDAYHWIEKEITTTASQAFVICPRIEDTESAGSVKAATNEYKKLQKQFPGLSVGLLHGRMKSDEKNDILTGFLNKRFDILVSTVVVEVGIDIPNATIIVIEAAHQYGLAQLHQLRGRVGRGDKQSYCLLFSDDESEETKARLKALELHHHGPALAELDLALRGGGDIFGSRQHGVTSLSVAKLSDTALVERAQKAVAALISRDPTVSTFPHLREMLDQSTIESIKD